LRPFHRFWIVTSRELEDAGVELGSSYPEPIIDHRAERERAIGACARARAG
jgi:deoxyribodipyrimidine photo-lyase